MEGVYILLGDCITPDLLSLARDLLSTFYKDHQILYGDNNCSLNVHNVGLTLQRMCNLGDLYGHGLAFLLRI